MHSIVSPESHVGVKFEEMRLHANAYGYLLECIPTGKDTVGRYRVRIAEIGNPTDTLIVKTLYNEPTGHNLSEAYRVLRDIEQLMKRLPAIRAAVNVEGPTEKLPPVPPKQQSTEPKKKRLPEEIHGHVVTFLRQSGEYIVHCSGLYVPYHRFDVPEDQAEAYAREYILKHMMLEHPPMATMWEKDSKLNEYRMEIGHDLFYLRRVQNGPYGKWWLTCEDRTLLSKVNVEGHIGEATQKASQIIKQAMLERMQRLDNIVKLIDKATALKKGHNLCGY